ncbi:hypothetical protein DPEC_G00214120 [Dallia pectoralis]|uniref:Uncharacterized protein n=1 Tax=Dallia pectoralis TaxID=75939 RepID=A0ACC2G256_DALPE|nr:hypothetical protein DPEC_G00214120 [Dallia pectoralis]
MMNTGALWTSLILYLFLESSQAQCNLCTNDNVQVTTSSINNHQPLLLHLIGQVFPGTQYTVQIVALAQDNLTTGDPRTVVVYTRPSVVSNLTAASTTHSVTLSWSPPLGNFSFYKVDWANISRSQNVTAQNATISDLTAGVCYNFTITVVTLDNITTGDGKTLTACTYPNRPVSIRLTVQTTTQLDVNWTLSGGNVDYYSVSIANPALSGTPIQTTQNTTNTTASFTSLLPGIVYNVTVTAVAGPFNNTSATSQLATVPTPPDYLNITGRTTSTIFVQWTVPSQMTNAPDISYNVSYWAMVTGASNLSSNTSGLSYNLTSLLSGTNYSITVNTVGPQGLGSTAVSTSAYTFPMSVLNLTATPLSPHSMDLQWAPPVDVKSYYTYRIQYSNVSGSNVQITVNTTTTRVCCLQPGTGTNFSVSTVASVGTESTPVFIFSYTKPKVVSNLTVVDSNTTAIRLVWSRQDDYKPTYSYLVTASNNGSLVWNYSTTGENYTFTSLQPGYSYNLSVVTVNQGVQSEPVSIVSDTKPGVVTNIVTVATTTNMTVWWSPALGAVDSYNVTIYDRSGALIQTQGYVQTSVVFQNLNPGTLYVVRVDSITGSLTSTGQNVSNATYPNPPGPILVEYRNLSAINISWALPMGMNQVQYQFSVSTLDRSNQTGSSWFLLDNLQSGTPYNITVKTVGALGYLSTEVTKQTYTRAYPVTGLSASTLNTTAVNLTWTRPIDYKSGYTYRVLIQGCVDPPRNQTSAVELVVISQLTQGTNCTFNVVVLAVDGTEGGAVSLSQYTKPERVSPSISNDGSNSSVTVFWSAPPGNVEIYVVTLNDSNYNIRTEYLNSKYNQTYLNQPFLNLSAGRLYTAQVTTVSGPFNTTSDPVTNATYPNPPGDIEIVSVTTTTIGLRWAAAPLMSNASFSYTVKYRSTLLNIQKNITTNTSNTVRNLTSGTTYNISVASLGPLGLQSKEVWRNLITTRPESVKSLTLQAFERSVDLTWDFPAGYQTSYKFMVNWTTNSCVIMINTTSIPGLDPGSQYNFSVTTQTADGTQGEPVYVSGCTTASSVSNLMCSSPDGSASGKLDLTWLKPAGQSQRFWIGVSESQLPLQGPVQNYTATGNCTSTCGNTVSGLKYYTDYLLSIRTMSCGKPSTIQNQTCKSGIGAPPVPSNIGTILNITKTTNTTSLSIQLNSSILNQINGPIQLCAVLVTSNFTGVNESNSGQYLLKTYNDWITGATPVYLATVTNTSSFTRAQTFEMIVGNRISWNNYTNGELITNNVYRFAVVLFTKPVLANGLLDTSSLYSLIWSSQSFEILSPTVLTAFAVWVAIGIVFLFIIIIITTVCIIYFRRHTRKQTTDIPIQTMRSIAVRVEDYEAYYKKQRADSNCGFAGEYEDLKPVGTAQARTSALALENKPKNRYNNVLPYDSSRVKLSIHGNLFDDYINCNYIPGYNSRKEFIAAQGPLPCTVNEFWRMIWEKNVQTLVMLTRCNEQGRVKCEKYWPSDTKYFENITVTTTSDIPLEDWTIREFEIKNVKTAETRCVRHFHFTAWPDHGVPETTELLINFRHLVREHMDQYSRHSPTVVHCSAGVGRTGTFIAIDRLIFQIERESMVDVYGIIHDQRMHRPLMVQTEDQYVFLNQCAMDIIRSRTGTNVDLIYQNTTAFCIYENIEPKNKRTKNGYGNP